LQDNEAQQEERNDSMISKAMFDMDMQKTGSFNDGQPDATTS